MQNELKVPLQYDASISISIHMHSFSHLHTQFYSTPRSTVDSCLWQYRLLLKFPSFSHAGTSNSIYTLAILGNASPKIVKYPRAPHKVNHQRSAHTSSDCHALCYFMCIHPGYLNGMPVRGYDNTLYQWFLWLLSRMPILDHTYSVLLLCSSPFCKWSH